MAQIYESLRGQITQDMIERASNLLDVKESSLSNAASSVVAGLLAILSKRGSAAESKKILSEAGNLNLLENRTSLFEGRPTTNQQKIGDDFLQYLLGDKAVDFTNPIAHKTGLSEVTVNRLVSMVAPVTAGYLGWFMKKENLNMSNLRNRIEANTDKIRDLLPTKLVGTFGLSNFFPNAMGGTSSTMINNATPPLITDPTPKKKTKVVSSGYS